MCIRDRCTDTDKSTGMKYKFKHYSKTTNEWIYPKFSYESFENSLTVTSFDTEGSFNIQPCTLWTTLAYYIVALNFGISSFKTNTDYMLECKIIIHL